MTPIEKLRAAVAAELEFARNYLRCVREGRYAGQPHCYHLERLRVHAELIAEATAALYRGHQEAERRMAA